MPSIFCTRCGFANEGEVRFCGRCGVPLVAAPGTPASPQSPAAAAPGDQRGAVRFCGRCATPNQMGGRFCGNCGLDLLEAAMPPPRAPAGTFPRAAPATLLQATPRRARRGLPWVVVFAVLGIAAAVLAGVSQAVMSHSAPACTVTCPPPPPPLPSPQPLSPSGPPLPPLHRFTSSTYGFSVDYPDGFDPSGSGGQSVGWSYTLSSDNSSFLIKLQGELANGRTPQQLVQAVQQAVLSGASPVFTITGAELGSIAGFGQVFDLTASPQGGQQQHIRLVIEAAIRNGVAVELIAESLYMPDQNEHPSPAQMEPGVEGRADDMGNTVLWPGEPAI